jgi:hypothetical protein
MIDLIQLTSGQLTKESLGSWAAQMVALIDGGDLNPLEAHAKAKAIMAALKDVIDQTEQQARDEADKYGGKTFEAFGAKITLKDGSVTPSYTDDAVWADIKKQLADREELLKLAFKTKDAEITDTNTGEVVPRVSAKYAKSSISIQFI